MDDKSTLQFCRNVAKMQNDGMIDVSNRHAFMQFCNIATAQKNGMTEKLQSCKYAELTRTVWQTKRQTVRASLQFSNQVDWKERWIILPVSPVSPRTQGPCTDGSDLRIRLTYL